jgi:transcriptional regulator with XRE-family HTH domain
MAHTYTVHAHFYVDFICYSSNNALICCLGHSGWAEEGGVMKINDRLRSARETTGKSQKEFAGMLGVSFRALQDYEAGITYPGGKVIEAYARQGFDANWLLIGEGEIYRDGHKMIESTMPPSDNQNERHTLDLAILIRDIVEQYEIRLEELERNDDRASKARIIASAFRSFTDVPSRYKGRTSVKEYMRDWVW